MSEITTIYTFSIVILFGILAGRLADFYSFPRMVPLILTGILISFLATTTNLVVDISLIRETTLFVAELALIVVLFREGMHLDISNFRKNILPILLLALVATLITVVLVGISVFFFSISSSIELFSISILGALLIGSIIVPTDPAATFSILRGSGVKIKEKIETILGGESALNDSIAIILVIVIFVPQLVAGNEFVVLSLDILGLALWQTVGGIIFGLLIGIVSLYLIFILKNQTEYSYITLATTFFIFAISIPFQISSAIAALVAGIVLRNPSLVRLQHIYFTRTHIFNFWDEVVFLFEIMAFVFIGVLFNVGTISIDLLLIGVILSIISVIGRVGGLFISTLPLELHQKTADIFSNKERIFISFSGFKGLTTAILASYAYINLIDVPGLETIANIILYSSIILILILGTIQGITIPKIAKKLDVLEESNELEELRTRKFAIRSELEKLINDRSIQKINASNFRKLSFPLKEELYLLEEKMDSLMAQQKAQKEFLEYQVELVTDTILNLETEYKSGEISSLTYDRIIRRYNDHLADLNNRLSRIKEDKHEELVLIDDIKEIKELELITASDTIEEISKDPNITKKIPELIQIQKLLKKLDFKRISKLRGKKKENILTISQESLSKLESDGK